jgi:Circadian oscillating protein COP23
LAQRILLFIKIDLTHRCTVMLPIPVRIPGRRLKIVALAVGCQVCCWVLPAHGANSGKFVCDLSGAAPVTLVRTGRGNIPVIRWVKKTFNGFGYDPIQRCRETSLRLSLFHDGGKLQAMRAGTTHGYPVLCIEAGAPGSPCSRPGVLLTFDKSVDPQAISRQLLDLRRRASQGPIEL